MQINTDHIKAEAYAQGRIDAGEPAFMDPDGFTSNTTVGAFAHHFQQAKADGHDLLLISAWSTFMSESGRTVIATDHVEDPEDEMPTVEQVQTLHQELGQCGMSRTYVGAATVRCTLRLGHSPLAKHTYTDGRGNVLTWTTDESDQLLAERAHYVPASRYSTEVTTTRVAVSVPSSVASDEQVAADLTKEA